MKHCLDFLAVAASGPRPAGTQLAVGAAAALLSREAAAAVMAVAGQAGELRTQATALRTLYCLCRAGGCGLTWQQLAAGGRVGCDAELVAGGRSIAAAVFAVAGAANQAAASVAKDGSCSPDLLAVQLYGLGAVGALLVAVEARSPAAGAALAATLATDQLVAAQEAAAAACSALGRSPQLLALLDSQQEGGDGSADFRVELQEGGCHQASWAEPVPWQPATDAVCGVCCLLRCTPEGFNAADKEGFTLLHRWAYLLLSACLLVPLPGRALPVLLRAPLLCCWCIPAASPLALSLTSPAAPFPPTHRLALAGQSRCLQLLLALGGTSLDLLLRTRGGANALQLARQHRHEACVLLLEGATLAAAEARQEALLAELEEMEEDGSPSAGGAKKSKKKKVRGVAWVVYFGLRRWGSSVGFICG